MEIGDYINLEQIKRGMLFSTPPTRDGFGYCLYVAFSDPKPTGQTEWQDGYDRFYVWEYNIDVFTFIEDGNIFPHRDTITLTHPAESDEFYRYIGNMEDLIPLPEVEKCLSHEFVHESKRGTYCVHCGVEEE